MSESASRHEELKALCKGLSEAQEAKNKSDLETLLYKLIAVTVEEKLLRATGAGQVVGRLRNYEDASIAALAKKVVHKWKKDVMASNARSAKTTSTAATSASAPKTGKPAGDGSAATKKQQSTLAPTGSSSVNSKNGHSSAQSSAKSSENPTPSGSNTPTLLSKSSAANDSLAKPLSSSSSQRTAASDNVNLVKTGDPVRDKCIELLYNSMSSDSDVAIETLANLSTAIEAIEFEKAKTTTPAYRAKIRSLCLNLRDKKNPELRNRVVSGDISAERLCSMSSEEMASEELKETISKMKEENLSNAKAPVAEVAETDQFRCGRCRGRRCTYFQMQTRSADEPMTTFVT
ncbi:transcription elongation factor TFIIS, partial [Coemansia erecta]